MTYQQLKLKNPNIYLNRKCLHSDCIRTYGIQILQIPYLKQFIQYAPLLQNKIIIATIEDVFLRRNVVNNIRHSNIILM